MTLEPPTEARGRKRVAAVDGSSRASELKGLITDTATER